MIAKKSDHRFLDSLLCRWFMWFKLYIILSDTQIWRMQESRIVDFDSLNTYTHHDTLSNLVPEPRETNMCEEQFLFCLPVIRTLMLNFMIIKRFL